MEARIGTPRWARWPRTFLALVLVAWGCTPAQVRRYELTGQILEIDPTGAVITIAHDAIPGYMSAMTMPFTMRKGLRVEGLKPGDLVRGRLMVAPEDAFLERLERIGHRELQTVSSRASAVHADDILEGDRLPDLGFIDQDGNRRRLVEHAGLATVMTFTYTRCPFPTFCPLIDRKFKSLQQLIVTDPLLASRVQLLSITIDPAHDTPDVLKQHSAKVGADPRVWRFLVADERQPGATARRFGVTAAPDDGAPSLLVHNLATVVVEPSTVVSRILRGSDWSPAEVRDMLKAMLGSR